MASRPHRVNGRDWRRYAVAGAVTFVVVYFLFHLNRGGFEALPCGEDAGSVPSFPQMYVLKAVVAFIRHGDRAPLVDQCWRAPTTFTCNRIDYKFPVEILDEATGGRRPIPLEDPREAKAETQAEVPCITGHLSAKGHAQLKAIGERFREDYIDTYEIISSDYTDEEYNLHATHIERTRHSAASFFAGLYPEAVGGDTRITITSTEDKTRDMLYPRHHLCDVDAGVLPEDSLDESYRGVRPELQRLKDALGEMRSPAWLSDALKENEPLALRHALSYATDCYWSHFCSDLIENPVEDVGYNVWQPLIARFLDFNLRGMLGSNSTTALRSRVGPALIYTLNVFNEMVNDLEPQPMHVLFTHDTFIMPVLLALGFHIEKWPHYAQMLRFEFFHHSNGDHSRHNAWAVRVLIGDEPYLVPGCEERPGYMCEFEQLKAALARFIPTLEECPNMKPPQDKDETA